MKTVTSLLLSVIIVFVPGFNSLCAQRAMNINKNDIRFLDTVHTANLVFRYDDLQIKNDSVTFIRPGTFKRVKHARPPFTFDNRRKDLYEQYFQKIFNMASVQLKAGDFPDAYYNLVVDIKSLEPGYHILSSRRRAILEADLIIAPRQHNDDILLKVSGNKIAGIDTGRNNEDFDNRIITGYGQLAYAFVKQSRFNTLPEVSKRDGGKSLDRMESFFVKETFGTKYIRNKRNEKLFMVLGIIQGGAGVLTLFVSGMMENPGGSPADQEALRQYKAKHALIGSGIAVSSVPFFIISKKIRTKAAQTRIFMTDNQPSMSKHYKF